MSHTLILAAVLLASVVATSALFRPPFLPIFGPRPLVPMFGPGPLLPIRPLMPLVPPVMPIAPPMMRFQNRQRRRRVGQQVEQVGSVESRPRTRPFVAKQTGQAKRSDRPIDGVTVNLIDSRDTARSDVYLVDYGRDGMFDSGMDLALAGPGLNFDAGLGGLGLNGPGVSAMDMSAGFLTDDRFRSGDISIDGNVYINNSPKPGAGVGGSLSAPLGTPVGATVGVVGPADVYDYALPALPLDTGSMALGGAPQAANVPLV